MSVVDTIAPTLFRAGGAKRLLRVFSLLGAVAIICCAAIPAIASPAAKPPTIAQSFRLFIENLWPQAQARGISRPTFELAFKGVAYDPKVIAHTSAQAEFVKPIWEYLASAVSPRRVERGRAVAQDYQSWFAKAERPFGVDPSVVVGIWGLETDFGGFAGSDNVIRALATLAYAHYRGDYFRDELLAALQILEEGDIAPSQMKGSWAGAMGQTQFMPSSFREFAVDFDGDGRRDIWTSAPDAIGSTANYLMKHGWIAGQPWGFEVTLPAGFDLKDADSSIYAPFATFAERGVKRTDGKALPSSGDAQLLITAGIRGPIFLVTPNFKVIKTYNNSTSYALAVALLGDRAMGAGGLQAAWPLHDRRLSAAQMREMQTRLKKMGYDVGEVDGKIGESARAALRAYQQECGEVPDGYPTLALLVRLRK
jgi:membrane-bound lytic murein transglycosylase B